MLRVSSGAEGQVCLFSILYSLFSISLFLYFYENVNVVISSVLSGALGSPAILVPYPISPLA